MDLRQEADQVLKAAAQAINGPCHNHVELPSAGISAESVELRALISALGAADAVVLVDLDDLEPATLGSLAQLALLVGRGLVDCGNPQVDGSAFHGISSVIE